MDVSGAPGEPLLSERQSTHSLGSVNSVDLERVESDESFVGKGEFEAMDAAPASSSLRNPAEYPRECWHWVKTAMPARCVFVVLAVPIFAATVWLATHRHADETGVELPVIALVWALFMLAFIAMYARLDVLSNPDRRMRMYQHGEAKQHAIMPDAGPRAYKRHSTGLSQPWDSFQFLFGVLLAAITLVFYFVCWPYLEHMGDKALAWTWAGLMGLMWALALYICSFDISKPLTHRKQLVDEGLMSKGGGSQALTLYCRYCKAWYEGDTVCSNRPHVYYNCTTGSDGSAP